MKQSYYNKKLSKWFWDMSENKYVSFLFFWLLGWTFYFSVAIEFNGVAVIGVTTIAMGGLLFISMVFPNKNMENVKE